MPDRSPFQYALLRVVPNLERGEFVNAGVVVFCRQLRFLAARIRLDPVRLRVLAPDVDPEPILAQLDLMARIADGDPDAGPIAGLPDGHLRVRWASYDGEVSSAPRNSRYLGGNLFLLALLVGAGWLVRRTPRDVSVED